MRYYLNKYIPQSAQEIVETVDDTAWNFFWFVIVILGILAAADFYHARNDAIRPKGRTV